MRIWRRALFDSTYGSRPFSAS